MIAYLLYRLIKIPSKISILIGVGSSICGGSAIAASAPVIGADDEEVAQSISVIFFLQCTGCDSLSDAPGTDFGIQPGSGGFRHFCGNGGQ